MSPVYVSPFLGAGADWLCLLDPGLVPLVSWMGGKRKLARDILALLDLRPGRPVPAILGDASWWGWVWPVVLDAETGPRVSEVLRSWRGEDPRALWFRLRDMGPITDDVAGAAAQLLWLQARAASGVPVWWEGEYSWARDAEGVWRCHGPGGVLLAAPGDGRERQRAYERSTPARLLQEASTQVDDAGQSRTRGMQDTRLMAGSEGSEGSEGARGACAKGFHGGPGRLLASDGRGDPRETGQRTDRDGRLTCDHDPPGRAGGGGIVDPGTIADRADHIRARLVKASGGEAGIAGNDGYRRKHGWRLFEPGDVADRADAVRRAAIGDTLILHADARTLTEEWAPRLGASGRWYFDPPYAGATGYPVACPRADVLHVADLAARHGGRVVVSEAVGLVAELGAGWSQLCLRSEPKPEWVTVYGCDVRAVLPPLLRMGAA